MFDAALPLWGNAGVCPDGSFRECLGFDGTPLDPGFKRFRVQARQVYVFAHAHLSGANGSLAIAERGWRFIEAHAALPGGGWCKSLTSSGELDDVTIDLYDQAMGLFSAAWWARASGDDSAIDAARAALRRIDSSLGMPDLPGWLSDDGPQPRRLQNPHMHMFEALLALWETTGDAEFLQRASAILELVESRLFDPRTGTLSEYFDDSWNRDGSELSRVVEPGHHFEWTWLLAKASNQLFVNNGIVDALYSFAVRHGIDEKSGLIFDSVLDDGTVYEHHHRLWPHTESLKAQLALFEIKSSLDRERLHATLDILLELFLRSDVSGTWIDRFTNAGEPRSTTVPASSLYHLFLAFAELLRLEPALRAAGELDR